MEIKKSPKVDLEKEKTSFLLMGFILALSLFFVLLEWNTEPDDADFDFSNVEMLNEVDLGNLEQDILIEEIPEPEVEEIKEKPIVYEDYNPVEQIKEEEKPSLEKPVISEVIDKKVIEKELDNKSNEEDKISENADIAPEFPGGQRALMRFLYYSMKYPEVARKQKIQGRVVCSFVIEKNGSVSEIKVEKGVYIFLDEEAIRVLKSMPEWKSGMKDGKPIRTKIVLPFDFKL